MYKSEFTDFDPYKSHNFKTEMKTYSVDKDFKNIKIEDVEYDVFLMPSEDDKCKVVCNDEEKLYHTVEVVGDTLTINRINTRKWYENIYFGINFGNWDSLKMTVYLPEHEYQSLNIGTTSGEIDVSGSLKFYEAKISNTSGNIKCEGEFKGSVVFDTTSGDINLLNIRAEDISARSTSGDVSILSSNAKSKIYSKSTSGNVNISNITAGEMYAKCTSGDINIQNTKADDIAVKSTSGDMQLKNVISNMDLRAESVSGDIELYRCDGNALDLSTVSGDVEGSIITEKAFIANTVSGEIDIPACTADSKCIINTTSGDIDIDISKK